MFNMWSGRLVRLSGPALESPCESSFPGFKGLLLPSSSPSPSSSISSQSILPLEVHSGWFSWFYKVVSRFFMVLGWFSWFFKVVSSFFMYLGWFSFGFMGFQVVGQIAFDLL